LIHRVREGGGNITTGPQSETPVLHFGMRNDQSCLPDDLIPIKQDIDIQCPWTIFDISFPAELLFDLQQLLQQVSGRQNCVHCNGHIQEIGLGNRSPSLGFINARPGIDPPDMLIYKGRTFRKMPGDIPLVTTQQQNGLLCFQFIWLILNTNMGSEIKTILYIIIGGIYLFSVMLKKAKKQQEEKKINKRPVSTKTADDIFKELQKSLKLPGFDTAEPKKPQARVPLKKEMSEKKPAYMSIKPRTNKPLIKRTVYKQDENNRKAEAKEKELHVPTMAETMDFDPRKAVIFSEILKRPQY
jgi:hypothetical protein